MDPHGTNRAHPIHEQRSLREHPSWTQSECCWDGVSLSGIPPPPQLKASARGMDVQHSSFSVAGDETCSMDKATYDPLHLLQQAHMSVRTWKQHHK